MGAKVTFNELTKIIEIDEAPDGNGDILIDVKVDLYSDGKEDWVANESLRKFYFPISVEGGKPLPGEKDLGSTFFLASDWKIRPYNIDHRMIVDGNLYAVDGSDPFLDTIGDYTVRIMQQVSDLVSTVSSGSGVTEQDKFDIADQVWDEILIGATHNVPASAGRRLRQLGDVVSSDVNDATPSNLKFITNLTNTYPDFYKDQLIRFTTGNLSGHVRVIAAYDEVTKEITVEEPMVDIPVDEDEFDIIPTHTHPMIEQADVIWEHITGLKLLGLVQENFVMDQQVYQDYNGAKLLTSARIRTYQDNAKTQLIATYQVTATWSSGQCTSYEMLII
jgi:hypothetical protein